MNGFTISVVVTGKEDVPNVIDATSYDIREPSDRAHALSVTGKVLEGLAQAATKETADDGN